VGQSIVGRPFPAIRILYQDHSSSKTMNPSLVPGFIDTKQIEIVFPKDSKLRHKTSNNQQSSFYSSKKIQEQVKQKRRRRRRRKRRKEEEESIYLFIFDKKEKMLIR
jgi:hypothetical protein